MTEEATRTVSVKEHGSVTATWYYTVEVPAGLTDEQAHLAAVEIVRGGQADPYDMATGDAYDDPDTVYGTDLYDGWSKVPDGWTEVCSPTGIAEVYDHSAAKEDARGQALIDG